MCLYSVGLLSDGYLYFLLLRESGDVILQHAGCSTSDPNDCFCVVWFWKM